MISNFWILIIEPFLCYYIVYILNKRLVKLQNYYDLTFRIVYIRNWVNKNAQIYPC